MMNWKQIARELPLNGKTQIECPENCGSGEKLSVNHSIKQYWCNCYRCGFNDVEFKGAQTLAEITRIQELNEAAAIPMKLELPHDYTTDIPNHGRLWLFKAGITESRWKEFNIGYSKTLDRVILPIYDEEGNLEWFQCRALLEGQRPKYIQPARSRDKIIFQVPSHKSNLHRVVIVEDILSAIRVGKHTSAVSLLGTKITTPQAAMLGKFREVIVWLDPDRAGRTGAYNIRRTLGLITEVKNIVTDKDPKELSDKQILEKLNGHNSTT